VSSSTNEKGKKKVRKFSLRGFKNETLRGEKANAFPRETTQRRKRNSGLDGEEKAATLFEAFINSPIGGEIMLFYTPGEKERPTGVVIFYGKKKEKKTGRENLWRKEKRSLRLPINFVKRRGERGNSTGSLQSSEKKN